MFKSYSALDYLCIDIANHHGKDKWLFEQRIQWVKDNYAQLEQLADTAEDKPLFIKAVHELRKVVEGKPTGHIVQLDATCSGIQIMSAITGCVKGADATGLVTEKRADAYTDVTKKMNEILKLKGFNQIEVPRKDVKRAVMTSGYGSTLVPKEVFGEGELLATFYQAAFAIAPAAFELMSALLDTWQAGALSHNWVMPDNFHVNIKVLEKKEVRVEVDELNHATFTTYVDINQGTEKGLANVANTIHSIDGYLLRSVIRRAAYDPNKVAEAYSGIVYEITLREHGKPYLPTLVDEELENMLNIYNASKMLDVSIIDLITKDNAAKVPTDLLIKLEATLRKMLELGSSPVITVHDSFGAHPNHCDVVRYHYKEIMAELAESDILQFIVGQITKSPVKYIKKSNNLADLIRNSNYAIC